MTTNENKEITFDRLILETTDLVRELRIRLRLLEELDFKEEEIIQLIFSSIMFEKDAELELAYECMNIVSECLGPMHHGEIQTGVGSVYSLDVKSITSTMYVLGCELIKQLKHLRAYHQGYLFYQFMKMIGPDIMLAKFDPPKISEND